MFFAIVEIEQVHFRIKVLIGAMVDQPLVVVGKVDATESAFGIVNQLGQFAVRNV